MAVPPVLRRTPRVAQWTRDTTKRDIFRCRVRWPILRRLRSKTKPIPDRIPLAGELALAMSLLGTGCAVLTPRFPDDVQTAVVRDDMRRMETETLVVYYPERREQEARRVAARIAYCVRELRSHTQIHDDWTDQKPRIVLADLPFNNAYVAPPMLSEPIEVLPAYNTTAYFAPFNLPPDPGVIGCHEAVHYVQMLQSGGFHRFITSVFGSGYTPQIGLELWFHEGVAVYYETKLQGGVGRLGSRYFEGILAAGVAGKSVNGGWLHFLNREPQHGAHYLVGSFFVDWLARTYGEQKLWSVVDRQAKAALPPFGVNLRFEAVYGKTLSSLLDEFSTSLSKRYPIQARSSQQRMVRALDKEARYQRTSDGWEAFIERGLDQPSRLLVRDPRGEVVIDRNLTDVMPGRTLIHPSPAGTSGMDFSPDRRFLYFVMLDSGPLFQKSRLVRVDLTNGRLDVPADDLGGPGGGLTPDGKRYVFARAHGDAYGLASLELSTNDADWIRPPQPGVYFHAPRVSPDGSRILAVRSDAAGTRLALLDARSGVLLEAPPAPPGPALEASWIDDHRVVFVGESEGRMQAFVSDLPGGYWRRLTNAPYLAFNPQSDGRVVRFLNREGWRWTLDEVALPSHGQAPSCDDAGLASPCHPEVALDGPAVPGGQEATSATLLGTAINRTPKLVLHAGELDHAAPATMAFDSRLQPDLHPVTVIRDEPYSQLDGLFSPQVRGPWFVVRDGYSSVIGIGALGGDRLGYHRWAVGVGVDPAEPQPSAQIDYRNALLAPVFIDVTLARYVSRERLDAEDAAADGHLPDIVADETLAALALQRVWYDSAVAWGWRFNGLHREMDDGAEQESRRFAGPFVGAAYGAAELTPYAGVRRGFSIGATATYLPKGLSTVAFNVTDVGGDTGFVIPLPFSKRHTFRIDGRARSLRGAPESLGLLQVGGGGGVLSGLSQESVGTRSAGVLPPGLRFYEPLRGFEDLARYGTHVVSGEAAYRFPVIIDRGTASSLSFLPSTFLRELAIEPFGSGATLLDDSDPAWAVGGSLDVGVAFWLLPLNLRFQLARRLSDDESWAFYFTLLGE